jgi:transcriptional regulator with XRE-family HTH domain
MILHQRIKELRTKMGLSVQQLAEFVEMDVLILKSYEEGSLNPPYEDLQKLSQFHKCSIDFILGIENNPDIKVLNGE